MKLGFCLRSSAHERWGGDIKSVDEIVDGMKELGVDTQSSADFSQLAHCDFLFLTNTILDLNQEYNLISALGKPYGIVCFQEDAIRYFGPAYGFFIYIDQCLKKSTHDHFEFEIEKLIENPSIIHYFAPTPHLKALANYEVIKNASLCITNSQTEEKTLLRDCPHARSAVIPWTPGFAQSFQEPDDQFLKWTGLKKGEYILQVGRLEPRKNQLATILATKDLDIPLVFIATRSYSSEYQDTCLEAIRKWRKGPTIVISETLNAQKDPFRILEMPGKEKLSTEMLASAYANAGLHMHPAFQELPGYTYLESAALGIPTIASSWTTIADYFTCPKTGNYELDKRIVYAEPHNISHLTQLVKEEFGKKYPTCQHPIMHRKPIDIAKEILIHLYKIKDTIYSQRAN